MEEELCPRCKDPDYCTITFEKKKKKVCINPNPEPDGCGYEKEIKEEY